MYLCLENPHIWAEHLNNDLEKIMQWANKWKIKFNARKTELMNISLNFGRTILEDTHSHKHLGIIFQNNCKWEGYIEMLIAKCRCQVACLRSFKYRLSRKALETMYMSFVLTQLDYADVIWDNCGLKFAENLKSLHLDAIRTIIGAVRGAGHQKLYTESGFTTLRETRFRHKIIMYHKIVQENTPTYLKEHLPPLVSSTNPYNRRRPLQRQVPKHKTETYRQSFFPSTTTLWNNC